MSVDVSHLLSLKVMRVSKPSLTQAAQPFFSTSPALSAHASASLLSLQGSRPLPGHPKTLRDFSLTDLLTLPSTFGAISLGETFSCAFCVNNEGAVPVSGVIVKAEIQTVTLKIPLIEFGGPSRSLRPNEPLEGVISHEIKELNQHVLAVTVSYLLPVELASTHNTGPPEDPENPDVRVFRKFYKFTVTNPLSVKTKVHLPKSPTALMSATEREKVFLEVHVQNLTSDPITFERMLLDCVDGWEAQDVNLIKAPTSGESDAGTEPLVSIFSGATAIMQPQDTRQYLFILSPKPEYVPEFPIIHQPGSIIPLGRLDISWRTGRLLTSVRASPISYQTPEVDPHAGAVSEDTPSYLTSSCTRHPTAPSPDSPPRQPGTERSPPQSPAFRVRNQGPIRPQSPVLPTTAAVPQHIPRPDIEVDLIVTNVPRDAITVEKPFRVDLKLTLSALFPSTSWPRPGVITPAQASIARDRIVRLVIQHILPPRPAAISQSLAQAQNASMAAEHIPLPSSLAPTAPYALRRSASNLSVLKRKDSMSLVSGMVSPSIESIASTTMAESPTRTIHNELPDRQKHALPSPFKELTAVATPKPGQPIVGMENPADKNAHQVTVLGTSVIQLPAFRFRAPPTLTPDPAEPQKEKEAPRGRQSVDFNVSQIAMRSGYAMLGGLRVLLVEDREVPEGEEVIKAGGEDSMEPRILKECDHVGEVWVHQVPVLKATDAQVHSVEHA